MGRRAAATRRLSVAGTGAAGVTLDAGALIALERPNRRLTALLERILAANDDIVVPAPALAQAWRGSPRQHRLTTLLTDDRVTVAPMDLPQALTAGTLLARRGTDDVVDAAVVIAANERDHAVITTDSGDLHYLDPDLRIIEI